MRRTIPLTYWLYHSFRTPYSMVWSLFRLSIMPSVRLSDRAKRTPPSPIRALSKLASDAQGRGLEVFHLNIGQPDVATPQEFYTGVEKYKEKVIPYEPSTGTDDLRSAWAEYTNKTLGLATKPDHYLITTGASEALVFAFMACCDPGDEIIVFEPTYANYLGFASVTAINLIPIQCKPENQFGLPAIEEIVKAITPKTKAILLCNPNNPTGTVFSQEEVELLFKLCEERNLFFVVDETYRELVFDKRKPYSILHSEPESDRVIVLDSISKRFSLCGARIGCVITSNPEVFSACWKMAQARLACSSIEQAGATNLLREISEDYVAKVSALYEQRRNVLCDRLAKVKGVEIQRPHGAFYTIVGLPVKDSHDFATYLLTDVKHKGATTFVSPSKGFYLSSDKGQNEIRVAFVLKEDDLLHAAEVIEVGLKQYGGK